ncbi:MAG TPA: class 1 fructose-bisphosphatase, partial [Bacteroidetes bacterium]|nr:class 1 fructose-bisphosphatase [Bacteroidota bacterium]
MGDLITIGRHILDTERNFPEATGQFTGLLQHIALAAKIVAGEVRRAGLVDVIGSAGRS